MHGLLPEPAGNTLFYDRKVSEMRPRGKADAVPPGWICAKAKRFAAPPVAAALLESAPPRARKASAKRAAVHKGGL